MRFYGQREREAKGALAEGAIKAIMLTQLRTKPWPFARPPSGPEQWHMVLRAEQKF